MIALAAVVSATATIALAAPQGDTGPAPVTVTINALNGSGEHGTAVLTKYKGDETKVTLTLQHVPGGANQPNHIHLGSCGPGLGAPDRAGDEAAGGPHRTMVRLAEVQ